ncbi:hypothetical protein PENTCL1PPCAC_25864, partial [Pristionchus entomophagus]
FSDQMSEDSEANATTGSPGLELNDEFKTFLMSHKDEVMRLLKDNVAKSMSKNSQKKEIFSDSESPMARRHRSDSTTSECSSEGGGVGEERRSAKTSKRRSRRDESSPSRSRSRSTSRPSVPPRFSTGRREAPVPQNRSRSRSRSPVRHRSGQEPRVDSRSRSRSRSSTPARYEAHLRSIHSNRRVSSSRHGERTERGSNRSHRRSDDYRTHHHHHDDDSARGGGGYQQNYDTGARRGGFIRTRNMIEDGRDAPPPSNCLGIFGMPPWVREYDLRGMFEAYGEVEQLNVVINRHTGQCRGYGFIYFSTVEEAKRARSAMRDAKIDGIPIRVDFSVTDQRRPSYRDHQ